MFFILPLLSLFFLFLFFNYSLFLSLILLLSLLSFSLPSIILFFLLCLFFSTFSLSFVLPLLPTILSFPLISYLSFLFILLFFSLFLRFLHVFKFVFFSSSYSFNCYFLLLPYVFLYILPLTKSICLSLLVSFLSLILIFPSPCYFQHSILAFITSLSLSLSSSHPPSLTITFILSCFCIFPLFLCLFFFTSSFFRSPLPLDCSPTFSSSQSSCQAFLINIFLFNTSSLLSSLSSFKFSVLIYIFPLLCSPVFHSPTLIFLIFLCPLTLLSCPLFYQTVPTHSPFCNHTFICCLIFLPFSVFLSHVIIFHSLCICISVISLSYNTTFSSSMLNLTNTYY